MFERKRALIIVQHAGRILLGRKRSKKRNVYGELPWMLPGGHVEIGEHVIKGAIRELREEVGKDIDARRFKYVGRVGNKIQHLRYEIFRVTLSQSEYREEIPPHEEFEEFKWVMMHRVPWDEMLPEHRTWLSPMLTTEEPLEFVIKKEDTPELVA